MRIGHAIRCARRRAGFSQRTLAALTGLAQPTIARIERGLEDPRFTTAMTLLLACGDTMAVVARPGARADRRTIRQLLAVPPAERLGGRPDQDTAPPPGVFDALGMLSVLHGHGARFVVIGAVGDRLWGAPTVTGSLDICHDRFPDNLRRISRALVALEAQPRSDDADPYEPYLRSLEVGGGHFTTRLGMLAVHTNPPGVEAYPALVANACPFDLGEGVVVLVGDLDDLMRMRRATGRPKDVIELEVLAAVAEQRERIEGGG